MSRANRRSSSSNWASSRRTGSISLSRSAKRARNSLIETSRAALKFWGSDKHCSKS